MAFWRNQEQQTALLSQLQETMDQMTQSMFQTMRQLSQRMGQLTQTMNQLVSFQKVQMKKYETERIQWR